MINHPAWCSPRCCREAGNDISPYGEHRSEPVDLDLQLVSVNYLTVSIEGIGTAYLTQSAPPWRAATYLRIEEEGKQLALPLSQATGILAQLSSLAATAGE